MPKLIVDGNEVELPGELTLLQACEEAGAEIPRFCYHERLSVAGNCRMCLVEVVGAPKPVASCAQQVRDLRPGRDGEPPEIKTKSPLVKKAREGVMEFLLINHPLDCPICDQGGECDLQDQSMGYGHDSSRYQENKRAVEDKYMGPLVQTVMTRCIQCTRCVRFVAEVAGVEEIGAIGRGEDMEITTYLEKSLTSELSGNVIDLCPVGALTSKPYAFTARPWELRKTEGIDVMDATGSNIRIDCRGSEVMRILPRLHEEINEEWISDKTRFVWDGLRRQRLDTPYVRKDGRLEKATWQEAFQAIAEKVKGVLPDNIGAIAGDQVCAESMFALQQLMFSIGSPNLDCRQEGSKIGGHAREEYLFNSTIAGIEEADAILLVGTNPRTESPIINARIRKRYLQGGLKVRAIGPKADLTYPVEWLGDSPSILSEIAEGSHSYAEILKAAERPMLILGTGVLNRPDARALLNLAAKIGEISGMFQHHPHAASEDDPIPSGWNGFNVLHTAASRVAGLDMGFLPQSSGLDTLSMVDAAAEGRFDVLYLLGADELPARDLSSTFVIYQGSHGDQGAHHADVILPGCAYTEKSATWVNTEGRAQLGNRAAFPPGDAREDWAIIRALSEVLGHTLPFNNLEQLRIAMMEKTPTLGSYDHVAGATTIGQFDPSTFGAAGDIEPTAFVYPISDFYLTNAIARASATMAECSKIANGGLLAQAAE